MGLPYGMLCLVMTVFLIGRSAQIHLALSRARFRLLRLFLKTAATIDRSAHKVTLICVKFSRAKCD